jgi:hypothetical protein
MKSPSTLFFALVALLPCALSYPYHRRELAFPVYHVTKYTTGCSPAGCAYSFNIYYTPGPCTTPPGSNTTEICEPGFNTTCTGTDIQGGWRACADAVIQSNEIPGSNNSTLMVRHQWDQDVTTGTGGVDGTFASLANYTVVVGVGEGSATNASFVMPVTLEQGEA